MDTLDKNWRCTAAVCIMRHAARTPKESLQRGEFAFGCVPGELTEKGWHQAAQVGRQLHSRLGCSLLGLGNCPPARDLVLQQLAQTMVLRATDSSRCVQTAQAIVSGLLVGAEEQRFSSQTSEASSERPTATRTKPRFSLSALPPLQSRSNTLTSEPSTCIPSSPNAATPLSRSTSLASPHHPTPPSSPQKLPFYPNASSSKIGTPISSPITSGFLPSTTNNLAVSSCPNTLGSSPNLVLPASPKNSVCNSSDPDGTNHTKDISVSNTSGITSVQSPKNAIVTASLGNTTPPSSPNNITPPASPTCVTPSASPNNVTPPASPNGVTPPASPNGATPSASPNGVTPPASPNAVCQPSKRNRSLLSVFRAPLHVLLMPWGRRHNNKLPPPLIPLICSDDASTPPAPLPRTSPFSVLQAAPGGPLIAVPDPGTVEALILKTKHPAVKALKKKVLAESLEWTRANCEAAEDCRAVAVLAGWDDRCKSPPTLKIMKRFLSVYSPFIFHEFPLPFDDLSPELFQRINQGCRLYSEIQFGTSEEFGWRAGGAMLSHISDFFNHKDRVGHPSLEIFVTHQSSLLALQNALCIPRDQLTIPAFGCYILAELLVDDGDEPLSVVRWTVDGVATLPVFLGFESAAIAAPMSQSLENCSSDSEASSTSNMSMMQHVKPFHLWRKAPSKMELSSWDFRGDVEAKECVPLERLTSFVSQQFNRHGPPIPDM